MPQFNQISKFRLATCHPDLQVLMNEVVQSFDCTILEGYRGREAQESAFSSGKSKVHYPDSKHNCKPSMAVDAAPWPIPDWNVLNDFIFFGGYVCGIAAKLFAEGKMTHHVRWGGDWNKNCRVSDNRFNDMVHFELVRVMQNEAA